VLETAIYTGIANPGFPERKGGVENVSFRDSCKPGVRIFSQIFRVLALSKYAY